jgi:hypothetical protein
MLPYAISQDLATYLGTAAPTDADRLLLRASEMVEEAMGANYDSTDTTLAEAARQATCAQVEYWLEVGEQQDLRGPLVGLTMGKVSYQYGTGKDRVSPSYLAPRAKRYLAQRGLLYRGVNPSSAGISGTVVEFFDL